MMIIISWWLKYKLPGYFNHTKKFLEIVIDILTSLCYYRRCTIVVCCCHFVVAHIDNKTFLKINTRGETSNGEKQITSNKVGQKCQNELFKTEGSS